MAKGDTVFDTMYEWSKTLDQDHIDEDQSEIEILVGSSRRQVFNQTVTVRGELEGVAMVVTWAKWHTMGFSANAQSIQNILDVFVTAKSIVFEGTLTKRGFFSKLFYAFNKGVVPVEHELFKLYKLNAPRDADFSFLDKERGDALLELAQTHDCKYFEFQADTGCSAYAPVSAKRLDGNILRSLTANLIKVVT